jgi:hypothetical protein
VGRVVQTRRLRALASSACVAAVAAMFALVLFIALTKVRTSVPAAVDPADDLTALLLAAMSDKPA